MLGRRGAKLPYYETEHCWFCRDFRWGTNKIERSLRRHKLSRQRGDMQKLKVVRSLCEKSSPSTFHPQGRGFIMSWTCLPFSLQCLEAEKNLNEISFLATECKTINGSKDPKNGAHSSNHAAPQRNRPEVKKREGFAAYAPPHRRLVAKTTPDSWYINYCRCTQKQFTPEMKTYRFSKHKSPRGVMVQRTPADCVVKGLGCT